MKKTLLLLALYAISTQVSASAALTQQQEARVQELVKETLLNHPEILAEAAEKLNQQSAQASQAQLQQVISENRDVLFNDPHSPRIGAQKPKLTLVVFTDYNCPYCKKFDPYLEAIVKKHPEVAVVFKFLPYRSESSLTAARDALTLWHTHPEQFLKFNTMLMAKKGYHDDNSIEQAKSKAGVILTAPDSESMATIKQSLALAEKLGIEGTPATLIGNDLLSGWVPFEQFDQMVSRALQGQS